MADIVVYKEERYYRSPYYQSRNGEKKFHQEIYKDAHGPIPKGYAVHHVDFNSLNNAPDNLIAIPVVDHRRLHLKHEAEHRDPIDYICQSCGKAFTAVSKKAKYCSKECNDREYRRRKRED